MKSLEIGKYYKYGLGKSYVLFKVTSESVKDKCYYFENIQASEYNRRASTIFYSDLKHCTPLPQYNTPLHKLLNPGLYDD